MFITPIETIGSIEQLRGASRNKVNTQSEIGGFKDIFNEMVNTVKETDNDLVQNQYLLMTGQIDDPHRVPIASAKAQLSVDLLIQMRNKVMDSYNELMRISL